MLVDNHWYINTSNIEDIKDTEFGEQVHFGELDIVESRIQERLHGHVGGTVGCGFGSSG